MGLQKNRALFHTHMHQRYLHKETLGTGLSQIAEPAIHQAAPFIHTDHIPWLHASVLFWHQVSG